MCLSGEVFHIAHCSVHDGPGIRTTVYLKGCNLSCTWCHNPEGQRFGREITFTPARCIGCGRCIEVCPAHHVLQNGQLVYLREGCTACGRCADECVTQALARNGTEMTAEDVMLEIRKDRHYYAATGGGVTFSGGECLLQADFLRALLLACRREGIHTLIESAFCVPPETVETVLPLTDAFYVDIKHMDGDIHRRYTGQDNARILENIARFAPRHPDFTVRIPLIPGVNDGEKNLQKTVAFAGNCGVKRVELLRYNPLGASKYSILGRQAVIYGEAQSADELDSLCRRLNPDPDTAYVYYIE